MEMEELRPFIICSFVGIIVLLAIQITLCVGLFIGLGVL